MVIERLRKGFRELFPTDQVSLAENKFDTAEVIYPLVGEGRDMVELECQEFVSGKKELTPENFQEFVEGMISLVGGEKSESGSASNYLHSPDDPAVQFIIWRGLSLQDIKKGRSGAMDHGGITFDQTDLFKRNNKTTLPVQNIEETLTFPFIIYWPYSKNEIHVPEIERYIEVSEGWQPPTYTSMLDSEEVDIIYAEDYERKEISYEQALQVCAKAFEIYKNTNLSAKK